MSFVKRRIARIRSHLAVVGNLALVFAAIVWRRTALRNVTLIAVTGSVGKTTAKECLTAILRRTAPTHASATGGNGRFAIPRILLGARPSHRFIVVEAGILKPGRMWRSALVLNPDVTVITNVNWQHSINYRSLDQVATEKAKLLNPLGRKGLAILNADNPLVSAMVQGRECRVRTFGVSNDADVMGFHVAARWPERLSLTIRDGAEEQRIQTRFVGAHWTPSVLAAVAAARSLGTSWKDCAEALAEVEPYPARLGAARLPNGADLLRDEYNGSFATFEKGLDILSEARCLRRVIAIGHIKDMPQFGSQGPEEVGRRAAAVGQLLLFWGSFKERYRNGALTAGARAENIFLFDTQPELADHIRRNTGAGDLILLKGYWNDHMSRIVFLQFGSVGCPLEFCVVRTVCDSCKSLRFQPDPTVDSSLLQPLLTGQERITER